MSWSMWAGVVAAAGVVLAALWRMMRAGRAVEARPHLEVKKDEPRELEQVDAGRVREDAARDADHVDGLSGDDLDVELAEYERRTAAGRGGASSL